MSANNKNSDQDEPTVQISLDQLTAPEKSEQPQETSTIEIDEATLVDTAHQAGHTGRPVSKEVDIPTLAISTPDGKTEKFPLTNGESLQVGREQADIVIPHPSVSALHCALFHQDGIVFLMENGSTNGTFLNGKRLKAHRRVIIDEDDQVYIGQIKASILMPQQPQPLAESAENAATGEFATGITLVQASPPAENLTPSTTQVKQTTEATEEAVIEKRPTVPAKKTATAQKDGSDSKIQITESGQEGRESSQTRIRKYWAMRRGAKGRIPINRAKDTDEKVSLANPFVRCWALLGDFAFNSFIVALLFHFPFSLDLIEGFKKNWLQEITPTWGEFAGINDPLDTLIIPTLVFVIFRLLCVLLLGVSLAQAVMGLRGGSSLLWNRLGGITRVFWEMILSGFVVFDLPLLWGKRSAKEFLSKTTIINGTGNIRLIASLVLIPLMMVLPLISGLILQWDYRDGMAVTQYNLLPLPDKERPPEKTPFFDFTSKVFQLSSFPAVDQERFLLLLGYDIISQNKKKSFRPHIALFDRKLNQPAYLKIHSKNILYQALAHAFSNDLSLEIRYPKVFTLLSRPQKSYAPLETAAKDKQAGKNGENQKNGKDQKVLDPQAINQIRELLLSSFTLNTSSVLSNLVNVDWTVNGLARLRKFFVQQFQLTPQSQIQLAQLNNHHFLKINPQPIQVAQGHLAKAYFIPVDTFNGRIYELNYSSRDKGEFAALKLLQHLFQGGRFYFDEPWPVSTSAIDLAQASFGQCLDYLLNSQTTDAQITSLHQRYLGHVDELALSHANRKVDKPQKQAERKFLLQEFSSLSEIERILVQRYPVASKNFAGDGFQFQLDRLTNEFK